MKRGGLKIEIIILKYKDNYINTFIYSKIFYDIL